MGTNFLLIVNRPRLLHCCTTVVFVLQRIIIVVDYKFVLERKRLSICFPVSLFLQQCQCDTTEGTEKSFELENILLPWCAENCQE